MAKKIKIDREELIEKLKHHFSEEFKKSLENTDLDEDEKDANIVLSRRKIIADAENIADLVFKAIGE
jgi:hypothetical protein